MPDTLVIQSHCSPLPYSWLESCLSSVRHWCELNRFTYQFIGDELFDSMPEDIQEKLNGQRVIASDLARLYAIQDALSKGYEAMVWLDADFLIFNPECFELPKDEYAVGREVWVQSDEQDKLKVYKKVHNAMLMFRKGNAFLDFYIDTAERLLRQNEGTVPPQFIGPKLLTALHNVVQLPVMESAGMLSPLVVRDVIQGGGGALKVFMAQSPVPVYGANLCISSCDRGEITSKDMEQVIGLLMNNALGV